MFVSRRLQQRVRTFGLVGDDPARFLSGRSLIGELIGSQWSRTLSVVTECGPSTAVTVGMLRLESGPAGRGLGVRSASYSTAKFLNTYGDALPDTSKERAVTQYGSLEYGLSGLNS